MPAFNALYTRADLEEIVKILRLSLYNQGFFCGAKAIRRQMHEGRVLPLPSLSAINRILSRHDLTHGRIGHDE